MAALDAWLIDIAVPAHALVIDERGQSRFIGQQELVRRVCHDVPAEAGWSGALVEARVRQLFSPGRLGVLCKLGYAHEYLRIMRTPRAAAELWKRVREQTGGGVKYASIDLAEIHDMARREQVSLMAEEEEEEEDDDGEEEEEEDGEEEEGLEEAENEAAEAREARLLAARARRAKLAGRPRKPKEPRIPRDPIPKDPKSVWW